MATWSGWQTDLLKGAGLRTAKMDVQFMDDWNLAAASNCGNNPVDISRIVTNSGNCQKLTSTRDAQKYPSQTSAIAAFSEEINSGNFPHLLAALLTDNPYTYSDTAGVVADLKTWGSPKQATYYGNNANPSGGVGSGGAADAHAPHAHKGWRYLVKSVGSPMTDSLRASNRDIRRAQHALAKARRIR